MKVEEFEDQELQLMRLAVKKSEVLACFFEGDEAENRFYIQNVTFPPVTFVKEGMTRDELARIVLVFGYRKAAQRLNVSVQYLRSLLKDAFLHFGVSETTILDPVTRYEAERYAKKIDHMSLLSAVTKWPVAKLRKLAIKMQLRSQIDHVSNLVTAKGRRAELFFLDVRASNIEKDMNVEQRNAPYDFEDKELGKVEVRSSKAHKTKTKGWTWYFSTKKGADHLACIGYCPDHEVPLFVKITKEMEAPVVLVREEELKVNNFLYLKDNYSCIL